MKKGMLIIPSFFGYEEDLLSEINERYSCGLILSNIHFNLIEKIISKIFVKYKSYKMYWYIRKELKRVIQLDFLVIVFSPMLSQKIIDYIRKKYKGIYIIDYLWDCVTNFPSLKDIAENCDIVYSFDKKDCADYGYHFLPLFLPNINIESRPNIYDFCSIYSLYPNKINSHSALMSFIPNNTNNFNHIFVNKKNYLYYNFISKEFRNIQKKDIKFQSLSRKEVYEKFSESKVIIDCPLDNQTGLSIRVFEALYLKKKLITTNKNVKDYEFYNENNILVLDDYTLFPYQFLEKEYIVNDEIESKYSLKNFVNTLFLNFKN